MSHHFVQAPSGIDHDSKNILATDQDRCVFKGRLVFRHLMFFVLMVCTLACATPTFQGDFKSLKSTSSPKAMRSVSSKPQELRSSVMSVRPLKEKKRRLDKGQVHSKPHHELSPLWRDILEPSSLKSPQMKPKPEAQSTLSRSSQRNLSYGFESKSPSVKPSASSTSNIDSLLNEQPKRGPPATAKTSTQILKNSTQTITTSHSISKGKPSKESLSTSTLPKYSTIVPSQKTKINTPKTNVKSQTNTRIQKSIISKKTIRSTVSPKSRPKQDKRPKTTTSPQESWDVIQIPDDFAPLESRGPLSLVESSLSPRYLYTIDELDNFDYTDQTERAIVLDGSSHFLDASNATILSANETNSSSDQTMYSKLSTHEGPSPIHPRNTPIQITALNRWKGRSAPHYPPNTLLSPVHAAVASWWRRVSLRAPDRNTESFIALGDSLSATSHFLRCFANQYDKWGIDERVRASLKQLGAGLGEKSPLLRESYATIPGATSWGILQGQQDSSPLLLEMKANHGRFALVLFGTNDLNYHRGLERFLSSMWLIGEHLLKHGVIPIFSTLPHRLTSYEDQLKVLDFNLAVRAISATMRVPLIDLYSALKPLKKRGLRSDLIHLNAYKGGCDLRSKGLKFGHNLRNYLSLKALSSAEVHLGAAALRGGGIGPITEAPVGIEELPPIKSNQLPWIWLGDPQNTPQKSPQLQAVCKELQDDQGTAVSTAFHVHTTTWFSTLAFHPPLLNTPEAPKESLTALIELKDLLGKPQGCLRLEQPHAIHKLAPGLHRLWLLSPPKAKRPYLFAIERRR